MSGARTAAKTTPTGPRRVGIYRRQSKDVEGTMFAIDRQDEDCNADVARAGDEVVAVFTDNDTSATSGKKRKDFERMKEAARSGAVDYIIAQNLDRLLRSNIELEELVIITEQTGVEFKCVTSPLDLTTPDGRTTARVLASIARGEVEKKNARQRRAGLQAAESGRVPARAAFGFRPDGEPHPDEAAVVRELTDKVIAGMPINAATTWLNDHGYVTSTGNTWDRTSVRKMLANPRNAGLRTYYGEVVATGTWTPIITPETLRAITETLANNYKPRVSGARKWLGSGLFVCGKCEGRMKSAYDGGKVRRYVCAGPSKHLSRTADKVDNVVVAFMEKLLAREDLIDRVTPSGDTRTEGLRAELKNVGLRIEQMEADYANQDPNSPDLMTWADLARATKKSRERRDVLNTMMAEAASSAAMARLLASGDPVAYWKGADIATQQVIVGAVCTVTIAPGAHRGSKAFDPETVVIEPKNVAGQPLTVVA